MHSNLRSPTSTNDQHQQQQHEGEVVPTNNFLMSQTHPSNSLLPLQFLHGGSSSSSSSSSLLPYINSAEPHAQDFPHSWSQLLLGGLGSEQEDRFSPSDQYEATRGMNGGVQVDVKQELSNQSNNNNNNNNNNINLQLYGNHQFHEDQQDVSVGISSRGVATSSAAWTHQIMPASLSPKSCITSLSSNNNNNNNNMLDFSTNKRSLLADQSHQHADHTTNSECNSTATGGVPPKKPRLQSSSTPPLKVRKEKLGDRITSLHQLVSPFGKTDTASVLLEAIGYIRFLQGQIEALSSPYLGNNNTSAKNNNQHFVHGERNCLFPDDPGQLLNDSCLKRRGAANLEDNIKGALKDLKSRGLCLVPISCTQLVGSDNGADYWAQSLGGF
ncbi:hypothetical protein BVRB_9g221290 [Beta vulgaris subsp. vulgaris]|nr:hypothetical protein BVRB_9g221290 [Beta vulgaris subsp. vulgaris]